MSPPFTWCPVSCPCPWKKTLIEKKIVNVYIVFDLDVWPKNLTSSFKFKNSWFLATSVAKNSNKWKHKHNGCEITFDSAGSWSFDNDATRNVITFGVHNNSLSHAHNCKNNFLVLVEGSKSGINGRFGLAEKNFIISFSKANTKFYLSLHYYVNEKEILKFKSDNKNVDFST